MPMGGGSGGGGAGGLVKLLTVTRGSTGILDTGASAIPIGHGNLYVVCIVRTAAAATTEAYIVRFNGDSGANYDQAFQQGNATPGGSQGGSTAQTSIGPTGGGGLLTGNTATANYAATVIIEIPYYDNTNWFKTGTITMNTGQTAAADVRTDVTAFGWRSTTAINQISLDSTAHPLTNSVMTVWSTQ